MATKLIETLGNICSEVPDSGFSPKINIQLFIDVKETVEDLQKVRLSVARTGHELIARAIGSRMNLLSRSSYLDSNWRINWCRSISSKGRMVLEMLSAVRFPLLPSPFQSP